MVVLDAVPSAIDVHVADHLLEAQPGLELHLLGALGAEVVEQAWRAGDRKLASVPGQWDADPDLLNTPAGILDTRNGALTPHRADAYMTRITSAAPALPGTPDLAFIRVRLAVFVDGCFWHGCPDHYTAPARNDEFWLRKLERNLHGIQELGGLPDAIFIVDTKKEHIAVGEARKLGIPVVAIDLPSGMSADTPDLIGDCIEATMTVTLGAPKLPLVLPPAETRAGDVVIADIGIPGEVVDAVEGPRITLLTRAAMRELVAPRAADSHKGDYGHVLIVAGSRGKTGAAHLAAMGALRSGAGLVTIATPSCCVPSLHSWEVTPGTASGGCSRRCFRTERRTACTNPSVRPTLMPAAPTTIVGWCR